MTLTLAILTLCVLLIGGCAPSKSDDEALRELSEQVYREINLRRENDKRHDKRHDKRLEALEGTQRFTLELISSEVVIFDGEKWVPAEEYKP